MDTLRVIQRAFFWRFEEIWFVRSFRRDAENGTREARSPLSSVQIHRLRELGYK
jgi:hypothetical protein